MSTFANSFWSNDYAGGLGVLFGKLQQSVQENQQFLTIARMRADAEEIYGQHMQDIGPAADRIPDGFGKDDGASVRKAYDGVRIEMEEAGRKHRNIASNIRELVVYPFSRWSEQHAIRVQHSQDDLQARMKIHDRQAESVKKLRSTYFNKCRLLEDLEEEDQIAFKDPQSEGSSSPKPPPPTFKVQSPEDLEDPEPVEIGDVLYPPEQVKKILTHLLEHITLGETKVPILGTYQNVSSGAEIVEYLQKHMGGSSVSYAERIGQDLITNGFLRLIGNVGNTFANSSRMMYQWRPKAFQISGIPEKKKPLERSGTGMSLDSLDSGSVTEYLQGWNPLNKDHPNETPPARLRREAAESDLRYKAAVRKLDLIRCTLEEAIIEHLKFMERCELDRLKAIKAIILDFSGAISNVIPSLQSTIDKMMLFQETVQPLGDLRYILENYRTGPFHPRVQIYENYYNSIDDQTFGVDLELRAKSDKKRVPVIISSILTYLDNHYPILDGDEARRAIWLVQVPLGATHRLRNEINNGLPIPNDILEQYEVPIVASLLKLYLLELPDSLVSSSLYDVIKTIYTTPATADPSASGARITVLQSTLQQLRLPNIATLDAIMTHFARLLDLTSADEDYTVKLAQSLAACLLRTRNESSQSFEEKYSYKFVRDLLAHKDPIFNELKRASSLSRPLSQVPRLTDDALGRPRAVSTDESNRRAYMEERARAIASRSRAGSPVPPREHRQMVEVTRIIHHKRDSSRGTPSETRFPVHATTSPTSARTGAIRHILDVPGISEPSPVLERHAQPTATSDVDATTNGHADGGGYAPESQAEGELEKKSSLGRSYAAAGRGHRKTNTPVNVGAEAQDQVESARPVGIVLVDRPMDD